MIFILIFLFIILILELIIIGIILSSITITIDNLKAETKNNRIYVDGMIVKLDIKLYKFIKVLSIKFYMHYLKIFGIKVYYRKALKYENKKQLGEKILEFIRKNKIKIKNLKPEFKIFKFDLNFGTEDVIVTSILTATFSGIIVMLLKNFVNKFDEENYSFKITPNYLNNNNFNMKFKTKIDLKMLEVISKAI